MYSLNTALCQGILEYNLKTHVLSTRYFMLMNLRHPLNYEDGLKQMKTITILKNYVTNEGIRNSQRHLIQQYGHNTMKNNAFSKTFT